MGESLLENRFEDLEAEDFRGLSIEGISIADQLWEAIES